MDAPRCRAAGRTCSTLSTDAGRYLSWQSRSFVQVSPAQQSGRLEPQTGGRALGSVALSRPALRLPRVSSLVAE